MDQPEQDTDQNKQIQEQLDKAASSYMDGDYQQAVSLWNKVLANDPENVRARQGIKKVHMLQSPEGAEDGEAPSAAVARVRALMEQRQFDAAAQACRDEVEKAGPTLLAALRDLEQRIELARAVEPEIQAALVSARQHLGGGKIREALPHLKQVLSLDRSHPVANRLMEAIRERLRSRAQARSEPQPVTAEPVTTELTPELPASGNPGCDAPPPAIVEQNLSPAPVGEGLPSSPTATPGGETVPEIELEMMSLDSSLEPGGEAPPAATPEETPAAAPFASDPDQAMESFLALGKEINDETTSTAAGEEIVDEGLPAIALEPVRAATSGETESPYNPPDANSAAISHAGEAPTEAAVDAMVADDPNVDPLADLLGDASEAIHDTNEPLASPPLPPPPAKRTKRKGGGGRRAFIVMAAIVVVAGLGFSVARWFELIPGFAPEPQTLNVAREAPEPEVTAPEGETLTDAAVAPPESVDAGETVATPPPPRVQAATQTADPREALTLFENGQDLFENGRLAEAVEAFEQAARLDPVNPDFASWFNKATEALERKQHLDTERQAATDAFQQKEFEMALRKFYRLRENDPEGSYDRPIVNAWYNWGLQLLAAGNLRESSKKLDEVLTVEPGDEEARAVKELIESYATRPKDNAFYLRVESLRYRNLDT